MGEISPFVDQPRKREKRSVKLRERAARIASELGPFPRPTNGDEERYENHIGNFTKGLPHNDLGEVDATAYGQLQDALRRGRFEDVERVELGGTRRLSNPLGGLAYNIEGPDSPFDGVVTAPPAFASPAMGAQMAELYWMALCRDVPLAEYADDKSVLAAVDDLGSFPGYQGPMPVTPQNLFRYDYPGATDGPMVSQFLLHDFTYDGIEVKPFTRVPRPVIEGDGIDFLTTFDEWLCAQRGLPAGACQPGSARFDTPCHLYSVRALGQNANQDSINSASIRAMLILNQLGGNLLDPGNPYVGATKQSGFATFGGAHLSMLVGAAHRGERHTWYQKWNMHRYLRPEAYGGRVHNVRTGKANYPVSQRLLDSPVLEGVFYYSQLVNIRRGIGDDGSYLLPLLSPGGGPAHPAYPAGHAVRAGACVTMLKAWFDESAEFPNPVMPTRDGSGAPVPYDGPPLTIGGELNKLAHNLSAGRDMSGVHWRADGHAGNVQGEEVAIRILREARATYPEPFDGFSLTRFNGKRITV